MLRTLINKINYLVLGIVLALIAFGVLYFWSSDEDSVITLGVFAGSSWDVPDAYTYEFLDAAISEFEKKNPNVTVKYVSGIQKEDYSEWLAGKLVSGDAPDVFMILPEDFSMLQRIGAIKNLDTVISRDASFNPDDYYDGAYEFGKIGNSQFALPFESAPDMMLVNKSMLERENIELPSVDWTWEDFYRICARVTKDTDANGVVDQFGVYNYSWEHAFTTNNVLPFDRTGSVCNLQDENAEEAVDFLKELYDLNQGTVVPEVGFDLGKVAFLPITLAEYRTYKPYPWSIKKYSNFDWDCIPLPRGPHGENISKMNTLLMGINTRTKNDKYAWELLKSFCYDPNTQMEIYKYRSGGAVLKQILNTEDAFLIVNQELSKDDTMNVNIVHSVMNNAVSDYNFTDSKIAREMLDKGIADIINNNRSTSIALKKLQREINQYIKK